RPPTTSDRCRHSSRAAIHVAGSSRGNFGGVPKRLRYFTKSGSTRTSTMKRGGALGVRSSDKSARCARSKLRYSPPACASETTGGARQEFLPTPMNLHSLRGEFGRVDARSNKPVDVFDDQAGRSRRSDRGRLSL